VEEINDSTGVCHNQLAKEFWPSSGSCGVRP
jgi:hypothetical protein